MILKPCPFCGGEAHYQDGYPYNIVKCISCGARSFTREDAIAAWNKRTAIASGELVPASAVAAERERCIDAIPCTAENPNEDAYQRGRFDGVMEYQRAIRALEP